MDSQSSWMQSIMIASFAFIFSLWAIAGSGQETVYWGFILLMSGIPFYVCLLYTSDAADERSSVDLGGRRIIKKKIS